MNGNEAKILGEWEFRYLEKEGVTTLQTRRVVACYGSYNGNVADYTTTYSDWANVPVIKED